MSNKRGKSICSRLGLKKFQSVKAEKLEYELPDGKTIDLGDARFTMGEIFFNPTMAKQEFKVNELFDSVVTNRLHLGFGYIKLQRFPPHGDGIDK